METGSCVNDLDKDHDAKVIEVQLECQESELSAIDDDKALDPTRWPSWRRWSILVAISLMNMIGVFATSSILPGAPQAVQEFHVRDDLYLTLLVSIWELGEGISPFFSAPLSERYGRLWIFHIGNLLGVFCAVACALSVNINMLVAFRFLNGAFLTALTVGPAISGDLFRQDGRGTAMAIAAGLQNLGVFIAPISGGFIAQNLGWRWTNWVNAIAIGTISILCLVVMRETYQHKLRERKTARQAEGTKPSGAHQPRIIGVARIISGITRPLKMLLISPTVFVISIYTAFVYGCTYLIGTTLTETLENTYAFSTSAAGLSFLALAIGNVLGMLVYGTTSDRYIRSRRAKSSLVPEHRLVHILLAAAVSPLGLLLYGWSAAYRVHWIVTLIGAGFISFSMMLAILATQNYLVDAYERYSASAIAAGVILRALSGALFPLAGPPLYHRLGLGWGNSVLALVAVVCIPLLVMLAWNGGRLRSREDLSASLVD